MPRISDLTAATGAHGVDDVVPIVQGGTTKKVAAGLLSEQVRPGIPLEYFAGASDDAKLGAAMSYVAGETYKPPIVLGEQRVYGPFTTPRDLFSGFKLVGNAGYGNQYRGALSTVQRVDVNTSGAWLRQPTGDVFDVQISNLSFYSQSSGTDFLGGNSSGVLWTSVIRDCGWSLFRYVLGSPSQKLLLTAVLFDGWWNINNGRNVAITIGGSDNVLWVGSNFLLDSPTSLNGSTPYHMWLDYLEKTTVGHVFCTAEQEPAAMRITGNDSSGILVIQGGRYEGRNSGAPSYGSVIRMEGGRVTFRDVYTGYGYANSGASGRSSEGGVVSVLGGRALFDGCWYARAVAETVPWVYASGSSTKVRIRNTEVVHDGGSFTGLPRVQAANGATLDVDNSVTVL